MCLWGISVFLLKKYQFKHSCPFFFCLFSFYYCKSSSYILDSTFRWFINIFSHLVGLLVSFLKISFDAQLEWLWNLFSLWDFWALEKVEPTTTTTPYRAWLSCLYLCWTVPAKELLLYFISLPGHNWRKSVDTCKRFLESFPSQKRVC